MKDKTPDASAAGVGGTSIVMPTASHPYVRLLPQLPPAAQADPQRPGADGVSAASALHVLVRAPGGLLVWHSGAEDGSKRRASEALATLDSGEACSSKLIPPPDGDDVCHVAAGAFHALMLHRSGVVRGIGRSQSGQLGVHALAPLETPQPVPVAASAPVRLVACGGSHSLFVCDASEVYDMITHVISI